MRSYAAHQAACQVQNRKNTSRYSSAAAFIHGIHMMVGIPRLSW